MIKKNILKKLEKELDDGIDYTFINLDLRKYPHKKGLFLAFNMQVD